MTDPFHYIKSLAEAVEIPENGILSRTLYSDDRIKVIGFGFSAGQELAAHTAPFPAMIQILQGTASLTLGQETREAANGTWVYMAPQLEHSIVAKTPVSMLLLLLKPAQSH